MDVSARQVVCDNLTKVYGKSETKALDSVTFSLPSRGIFVLIGRNGSGKTTLVRILAQMVEPKSASVSVLSWILVEFKNLLGPLRRQACDPAARLLYSRFEQETHSQACPVEVYGLLKVGDMNPSVDEFRLQGHHHRILARLLITGMESIKVGDLHLRGHSRN